MIVRVLFFASLKDNVGKSEASVEIEDTSDVAGLWDVLKRNHPGLREVSFRPLAACDMTFAAWDRPLRGVREVAFLPPVSGG